MSVVSVNFFHQFLCIDSFYLKWWKQTPVSKITCCIHKHCSEKGTDFSSATFKVHKEFCEEDCLSSKYPSHFQRPFLLLQRNWWRFLQIWQEFFRNLSRKHGLQEKLLYSDSAKRDVKLHLDLSKEDDFYSRSNNLNHKRSRNLSPRSQVDFINLFPD